MNTLSNSASTVPAALHPPLDKFIAAIGARVRWGILGELSAGEPLMVKEIAERLKLLANAHLKTHGRAAPGGHGDGGPRRSLSHPAALSHFHRRPPRGFWPLPAAPAGRERGMNVLDCAGRAQRRRRFSVDDELASFPRLAFEQKAVSRCVLPAQSKIVTLHSMTPDKIPWPHAPEHRLCVRGTYFVTVSAYLRQHHFASKARLAVLHRGLPKVAADFGWRLEAWAVFSNHYHFVGHSPADADTAENLSRMLGLLHEKTARWINKLDKAPARKVWHNYRETRLTYEKSYLARLNYVHQNPLKHGLVPVANLYPWCSARWFERTATPAQIKTIYRFKTDQMNVPDDFEVSPDW